MPPIYIKDGGTWKEASPSVKNGGAWVTVQEGWVKDAGTWKQFYANATPISVTITSNQLNLDLRAYVIAQGWDGAGAVTVTVNSGVYIWSNNTSTPAMTITGSFPGGITLINNGNIMGQGGNGYSKAAGGTITNATAGGHAISLGTDISINNIGYIGGGGGGGGIGAIADTHNGQRGGGGGGAGGGIGGRAFSSTWNGNGGVGGAVGAVGGNPTCTGSVGDTGNPTIAYVNGKGGGAGGGGAVCGSSNAYGTNNGGGGGGGRQFPGSGGAVGTYDQGFGWPGVGGAGNAAGQTYQEGNTYTSRATGSGGGGWGAAGGGDANAATAAGGKAIAKNTYSVTWLSGTTQVYGLVS